MGTPLQQFPVFGPRSWVFGVLNVTPDSFSDGGRWDHTAAAVERGLALVAAGADVVDVGGESTRPGAHRIDSETEAQRVLPVIRELHARGILCSVDTTRAVVAAAALEAGAVILNDVSGGLADAGMAQVAADSGAPWILMHWRGHSDVMAGEAHYGHVVDEVCEELKRQVDRAIRAGVDERSLILDPGLGFAKNSTHNWELVRRLEVIVDIGLPVLLGASRKRFLGELLAGDEGGLRPAAGREAATAAVSLIAAQKGAWAVRVHEPQPSRDALEVLAAARRGSARVHPEPGVHPGVPGPLAPGLRTNNGDDRRSGSLTGGRHG